MIVDLCILDEVRSSSATSQLVEVLDRDHNTAPRTLTPHLNPRQHEPESQTCPGKSLVKIVE